MIKKRILCVFIFLFVIMQTGFASVMSVPRRIFILSSKYFDFLFPEECTQTAYFLAEKADALFEKATNYLGDSLVFRIPVIISPDSDVLSVSYSPIPYNRILVYEGVPSARQLQSAETLLTLFNRELIFAVNESIRSPFVQKVHDITHIDSLQPIPLMNLPFSFVEGIAYGQDGIFHDKEYLQLLMQAKIEGEFPTWFQASARRDVVPGNELAIAAGSAFTAFIQQRWGFEKYQELWKECSKLNFLFTPGNFYKVYGMRLEDMWKSFEQSIPLPPDLNDLFEKEKKAGTFFWDDSESRYKNLIYTEYGIIWYDDIRHEVDIYDLNSPIKIRQLLFLAEGVEHLSVSPDGRYLSVSYRSYQARENFKCVKSRIFDLKKRSFVLGEYELRDSCAVLFEDGSTGIAGLNVKEPFPVMQVYKEGELIFERMYDYGEIPVSAVGTGVGKILFIMEAGKVKKLCLLDIESGKEKCFATQNISISNLSRNDNCFTFQYTSDRTLFPRMGYFLVDENSEPEKYYLQEEDFLGGVNYPVIKDNLVFYSSHKLYFDNLFSYSLQNISFSEYDFSSQDLQNKHYSEDSKIDLQDLNVTRYNPFNYIRFGAIYPMVPAKSLDLEDGIKLWPGVGITFVNNSDLMENTQFAFSGAYALAKLDYSTLNNPSADEILEMESEDEISNSDYSFIGYVKNSSTPVDLAAGATYRFNNSGFYDFRWLAGLSFELPMGMTFRNLRLGIQAEDIYSTSYYEKLQKDFYPDKDGWSKLKDSYRVFELSSFAEYKNYVQYGVSAFEMRGIKIKGKIYCLWDFAKEKEEYLSTSLYTTIGIPRLTPFQMHNGWIFSAPGTVTFDFMGKYGSALETSGEILLIGREIQNGFPWLYLYFNRFGVKGGYDLSLNYNTNSFSVPDIRAIAAFSDIFQNTHVYDNVYLKLDLDFVPPVGRLSSAIIKSELKAAYYIRSKGFKFSVNLDFDI